MKWSVIVGTVVGVGVMVFVNRHEGDPIEALLNMESAVIVFGGCLAAALSQFQIAGLMDAIRKCKWLVRPPSTDPEALIQRLEGLTRVARRDGLLALEKSLPEVAAYPLLREGLQMVVDGIETDALRTLLRTRVETESAAREAPGALWDAVGGYAPTMGVLGAVMGLIHVMMHLNGGTAALGAGIATAFTATMYGLWSANVIFIPFGKRISAVSADLTKQDEMAVEGLILIADGSNPQTIHTHLQGFVPSASGKKAKRKAPGEQANGPEDNPAVEPGPTDARRGATGATP